MINQYNPPFNETKLKGILIHYKGLLKKFELELKHNLENDDLGYLRHHYYDLVMSTVLLEQMYQSIKIFGHQSYNGMGFQTFIDSISSMCRDEDYFEQQTIDETTKKLINTFNVNRREFNDHLHMIEVRRKSEKIGISNGKTITKKVS